MNISSVVQDKPNIGTDQIASLSATYTLSASDLASAAAQLGRPLTNAAPQVNLLAPGQILKLCAEAPVPWIDQPQPGKDARFGDASSLDRVSLDVYLTIARRFGARIFDPHQEGACTGTLLLKEQLYQQRISQCDVCQRIDHPGRVGRPCNAAS